MNSFYNKTIILPEDDARIIEASNNINFCNILLIGEGISSKENVNYIDNKTYKDNDILINELYDLRKDKGLTIEDARDLITNNKYVFSLMLLRKGIADGVVCGATLTSKEVIGHALRIIGSKGFASSFTLIDNKDKGLLLFSDTGLNIDPSIDNLVSIAEDSCKSYKKITGNESIVGFLSHSTDSSCICDMQNKMHEAAALFKEKNSNIRCDYEMQFDAAIDQNVSNMKIKNSNTNGLVNTFIFPNLDSANIAYKVAERLGNNKCYGPIIQGLNKPVNDISRGSSVEDIIGTVYLTVLMSL